MNICLRLKYKWARQELKWKAKFQLLPLPVANQLTPFNREAILCLSPQRTIASASRQSQTQAFQKKLALNQPSIYNENNALDARGSRCSSNESPSRRSVAATKSTLTPIIDLGSAVLFSPKKGLGGITEIQSSDMLADSNFNSINNILEISLDNGVPRPNYEEAINMSGFDINVFSEIYDQNPIPELEISIAEKVKSNYIGMNDEKVGEPGVNRMRAKMEANVEVFDISEFGGESTVLQSPKTKISNSYDGITLFPVQNALALSARHSELKNTTVSSSVKLKSASVANSDNNISREQLNYPSHELTQKISTSTQSINAFKKISLLDLSSKKLVAKNSKLESVMQEIEISPDKFELNGSHNPPHETPKKEHEEKPGVVALIVCVNEIKQPEILDSSHYPIKKEDISKIIAAKVNNEVVSTLENSALTSAEEGSADDCASQALNDVHEVAHKLSFNGSRASVGERPAVRASVRERPAVRASLVERPAMPKSMDKSIEESRPLPPKNSAKLASVLFEDTKYDDECGDEEYTAPLFSKSNLEASGAPETRHLPSGTFNSRSRFGGAKPAGLDNTLSQQLALLNSSAQIANNSQLQTQNLLNVQPSPRAASSYTRRPSSNFKLPMKKQVSSGGTGTEMDATPED